MGARTRRSRPWRALAWGLGALVLAGSCVLLGRVTAGTDSAAASEYAAGQQVGYSSGYSTGYSAGLQRGNASGRQQGRTAQAEDGVPAGARRPVKVAFTAGYVAGANDAFTGYDGGWGVSDPYVITVERGVGDIVYRISSRTPVQPGVSYYLCSDDRTLCEAPRP